MELYQIRTFAAVAEEGNLTRASERLFTSQPAVSAHIKTLEEELGVELFTRSRKGMQLTEAGRLLLGKAERVLATAADLVNQAKALQCELIGSVKIGLNSFPSFLKISELFSTMSEKYPRLDLHLIQSQSARVMKYVKSGDLDGGFYLGKNDMAEISIVHLSTIHLVVAGPMAMKGRIEAAEMDDIAEMPWIWRTSCGPFQRLSGDVFCNACFQNTRAVIAEDDVTMKSLTVAGAGLALMEETEAQKAAKAGEIAIWPGGKTEESLSFIYLAKRGGEPALRAVLDGLATVWNL